VEDYHPFEESIGVAIMQVTLGTAAAQVSLDEFVRRGAEDEIEIVDANGTALAYLIPAPRTGDETYSRFETVFQSHSETLRRRAAKPACGISTEELLTKLHALDSPTETPCDSR
jgi:hypothetical protein